MILTIHIPERVWEHYALNYEDPRGVVEAVIEAFVAEEEGWEDEEEEAPDGH